MSDKKTVKLEDATPAELRYYASTILQIDGISPNHKSDFVIGKIRAVNAEIKEIDVPDNLSGDGLTKPSAPAKDITPKPVGAKAPASTHFTNDPRVEIMIPKANDGKPKRVPVTVNGDSILIERGVAVKIPYRHYLALTNAKEIVRQVVGQDPLTQLDIYEDVETPSYPVTTYRLPSDEEIAEWNERVNGISLAA